jgi:hypothetical protein
MRLDTVREDAANAKIDPELFWKDHSKIMAGIGMVLSGIGSGLTGQPNLASQYIDSSINRNIEAQKATMQQGNNLYGWELQRYGDARQAETATRAMLQAHYAGMLQSAALSQGDAATAAQAKVLESNLMNSSIQAHTSMANEDYQARVQKFQSDRQMAMFQYQQQALQQLMRGNGQGGQGGGYLPSVYGPTQPELDPADPSKSYAAVVKARNIDQGREVPLPELGGIALAAPGDDVKGIRDQREGLQEVRGPLSTLDNIITSHRGALGAGSLPFISTDEHDAWNKATTALSVGLPKATAGSGAVGERVNDVAKDITGSPIEAFLHGKKTLNSLHDMLDPGGTLDQGVYSRLGVRTDLLGGDKTKVTPGGFAPAGTTVPRAAPAPVPQAPPAATPAPQRMVPVQRTAPRVALRPTWTGPQVASVTPQWGSR